MKDNFECERESMLALCIPCCWCKNRNASVEVEPCASCYWSKANGATHEEAVRLIREERGIYASGEREDAHP